MSDVTVSVATTDHSSDGRLTSRCLSLLHTTVATGGFCLSLLCYHYSNTVVAARVARDHNDLLSVATMSVCTSETVSAEGPRRT
jgi:hypothetical protein